MEQGKEIKGEHPENTTEPGLVNNVKNHSANILEHVVVNSRWVLMPMYLGLILVMAGYCWKFVTHLGHCVHQVVYEHVSENEMLIMAMTFLDMLMIANLILYVLIGSYSLFVNEISSNNNLKWLHGITSGTLKTKMGQSIIGVSTIYILILFNNIKNYSDREVYMSLLIHIIFIVSTWAMVKIDNEIQH